MPSREAQRIIGVIAVAVIVLGTQMVGLHRRIDDVGWHVDGLGVEVSGLRNEAEALWTDVDDVLDLLNARLRAVEVAFGQVDQRLATIERLKLWIGASVLTVVLAVVGTRVAVATLVIGNVTTQISDVSESRPCSYRTRRPAWPAACCCRA